MNKDYQLLLKVNFGSHLYGTNTPESDTDYKSVFVPDGKNIIMQSAPRVITNTTGSDTTKNNKDDVDDELFSLIKFFDMLKVGDMIAIELLCCKKKNCMNMNGAWYFDIHKEKERLISRNIKGFVGYIRKQANRYGIKGSRVAAARDARDMFGRLVDRLGHQEKLKVVARELIDYVNKHNETSRLLSLPLAKDNCNSFECFIEILNRKLSFNISLKEAYSITNKIFDEYGSRALAAELNQGVDWKSLYHAIRVSEQAKELLDTGDIVFPRHNAKELLKIKYGNFSYADVADRLERNLDDLERMMLVSDLPEKVDEEYINDIIESYYLANVREYYGD